jgi:uncharacterized pyridoxal phosphate-containing UPF0001 family protein
LAGPLDAGRIGAKPRAQDIDKLRVQASACRGHTVGPGQNEKVRELSRQQSWVHSVDKNAAYEFRVVHVSQP